MSEADKNAVTALEIENKKLKEELSKLKGEVKDVPIEKLKESKKGKK